MKFYPRRFFEVFSYSFQHFDHVKFLPKPKVKNKNYEIKLSLGRKVDETLL